MNQKARSRMFDGEVTVVDIEEVTTSEHGVSDESTEVERFDLETAISRFFKRFITHIKKNLKS